METITKLPDKKGVIGAREIARAAKAGKIRQVVVASNCPGFLIERIEKAKIDRFDGDQSQLGTKLGKPFPVAMVGYE